MGIGKKGRDEEREGEDGGDDSAHAICTFPLVLFDGKVPKGVHIVFVHFI